MIHNVAIPALLLALCALNVHALTFRAIENDGFNRRVLLVYDCGTIAGDPPCLPHEKMFTTQHDNRHALSVSYKDEESLRILRRRLDELGFRHQVDSDKRRILYAYRGDEAEIRSYLGTMRYEEAWLLSGGGQVVAGLSLGGTLRDFRMSVRVPSATRLREAGIRLAPNRGAECVSSCTIAFMGGLFRYIDENATYQVHAASSVSRLDEEEAARVHRMYLAGGLGAVADEFASDARTSVRDMLVHFQNTLLLPIRESDTRMERERRDRELRSWVLRPPGKLLYPPDQLERDTRIYELEGKAALQDIIMRLERKAINLAIADLRVVLPNLGRRADSALDMVAVMYDTSSIKESNVMARETLFKMGYITEDVR